MGASAGAWGTTATPALSLRTPSHTALVFSVGEAATVGLPALPAGKVRLGSWRNAADSATSRSQYGNDPTGDAGQHVAVADHGTRPASWTLAAVGLRNDEDNG